MILNVLIVTIIQLPLTFLIIYLSKKFKLLDVPNNRKIHQYPVAFTGGITISLTVVIINFFIYRQSSLNEVLFISFFFSIIILIDDKFNIKPILKLFLQIIIVFFFINYGILLDDLGTYPIIGKLGLGNLNFLFTFLCFLLLINAFNYNDGIDGQLGCITIYILLVYLLLLNFLGENINNTVDLISLFIISISIFLLFNFGIFKDYKLFLGDSGSNYFGLIIGIITIINYTNHNIHPAIIIWPLSYIVYEFLSTNIIRIIISKNLFKPGKDHLHYELIKIFNLSQFKCLLIIIFINLTITLCGITLFYFFGPLISIIFYPIIFLFYLFFRYKIFIKKM